METRADRTGRWVLRIAGLTGLAIFAFFFSLTYSTPEWVENYGRDFIEQRTWERIDAGVDAIGPPTGGSKLEKLAAGVYQRNSTAIESLKAQLKDRGRDLFLVALDQVRDLECECRQRIETAWRDMNVATLARLVTDNQRVIAILQNGYMQVVNELRREIRIFSATNAAAFLFLLLVSFAKPAASRHLLFPGLLLLSATLFCAFLYLFSQDWLLTMLHGSYVGWAYAAYLALVFLFLCDIAFNRGRVTTRLLNGVNSSLGGIVSALTPC
jgi:hypothetical protein